MNALDPEIVPLDADDTALVEQVVGLVNAVRRTDSPWSHPCTVNEVQGDVRYGWELEPGRHYAVLLDGRAVALGHLETTDWDNRDLAWLDVTVHPEHRRRGLGTATLRFLVDEAAATGRTKLGIDGWDGEAPRRFAARFGFTLGSQAINRRQHLAELSLDALRNKYDEARAHASSYELLRISGRVPEELLPAVSEMWVAINDAPLDDLDIEDEVFPPQRIRDYETATLQRGQRLHRVVARHRGTGELAGHTVVAVEEERPWIGAQHDTSVVRAHRGHRLGLLLKAEMNLWLADTEPQLETVDTWNAESNDHMIAVNELLAYRWMGRGLEFMSTVGKVRQALGAGLAVHSG
ncbi:MAG TPA: GNAT family N-acetyltransferase [Marmoricola sp.]|nr:GNAT family N-acetyltransferase [Marmoricola sp.]